MGRRGFDYDYEGGNGGIGAGRGGDGGVGCFRQMMLDPLACSRFLCLFAFLLTPAHFLHFLVVRPSIHKSSPMDAVAAGAATKIMNAMRDAIQDRKVNAVFTLMYISRVPFVCSLFSQS